MKTLVYKIVMTNTKGRANKVWCGELFDNGDVVTKWGPINGWEKSKTFKQGKNARTFLTKKMMEKEKKNYQTILSETY